MTLLAIFCLQGIIYPFLQTLKSYFSSNSLMTPFTCVKKVHQSLML